MDPINYGGAFADLPPPGDALMQGVKNGAGLQQLQVQQQQQALAMQQAQAAQAQKEQMAADMSMLSQNPTPDSIAKFSIKYPQLSEQMKRSFDMIDPREKQAKLEHLTQVYSAFNADKPEIALQVMRDQAAALRNSGDERGAGATEAMARVMEMDPVYAKIHTGNMLAAMAGPEKFAETFAKMGGEQRAQDQAPGALRKVNADADAAESDAATKAVLAKHADSQALADLAKKQWDVKKIVADIGFQKESNRIAAMNASYNREGNQLKRDELRLKIDDAARARDEKVNERVAQAEGDIAAVTDTVSLIDEIFADRDTLQAVTGASAWRGMIPGTKSKTAAGKIEQLTNMLAAANLDKLKGPMSDKDILFVKRISGNIDRYQDEDLFAKEMGKVRDIMVRTEAKIRAKYGAPPPGKGSGTTPAPSGPREIVVDF